MVHLQGGRNGNVRDVVAQQFQEDRPKDVSISQDRLAEPVAAATSRAVRMPLLLLLLASPGPGLLFLESSSARLDAKPDFIGAVRAQVVPPMLGIAGAVGAVRNVF